jgi:hypothetical protein
VLQWAIAAAQRGLALLAAQKPLQIQIKKEPVAEQQQQQPKTVPGPARTALPFQVNGHAHVTFSKTRAVLSFIRNLTL